MSDYFITIPVGILAAVASVGWALVLAGPLVGRILR